MTTGRITDPQRRILGRLLSSTRPTPRYSLGNPMAIEALRRRGFIKTEDDFVRMPLQQCRWQATEAGEAAAAEYDAEQRGRLSR